MKTSLPSSFKDAKHLFVEYLEEKKISRVTIRNYLSDLSTFLEWAISHLHTTGIIVINHFELIPHLTHDLLSLYKNFLIENKIPVKTANRRLSTIRHFCKFLTDSGLVSNNPAQGLENITEDQNKHQIMLAEFRKHLEEEKVNPKTIKNYIADIHGFLNFLDKNQ